MRKKINQKVKVKQNVNVNVRIDNSHKPKRRNNKRVSKPREESVRTQHIFMTTPVFNPPPTIFNHTPPPNPIQTALENQAKNDVSVSNPIPSTPISSVSSSLFATPSSIPTTPIPTPAFKKDSEKLATPIKFPTIEETPLSTPSFKGNPLITELAKKLKEREEMKEFKKQSDEGENPLSIYQRTRIPEEIPDNITKREAIEKFENKEVSAYPNDGVKFYCPVCKEDFSTSNRARHLRSKKHQDNTNAQNLKEG